MSMNKAIMIVEAAVREGRITRQDGVDRVMFLRMIEAVYWADAASRMVAVIQDLQ